MKRLPGTAALRPPATPFPLPPPLDHDGLELAMPIDDLSEVNVLMAALEAALPLPMLLAPQLRATLTSKGLRIDMDQHALVEKLFYGGDEGRVLCGLRPQGVEDAVVVSLTHLLPEPDHPLAPMIIAYQRRRVARITRQHRRPAT